MILVDTGYLVAIAQPADALHLRAVSWAKMVSEPTLVTEHVLWETVNFLSTPGDRPKVRCLIDHIQSATAFEIAFATCEMFEAGLGLHSQRSDKEWSLTDCISFLIMQRRGIERALTYDHHFEQAGFEAPAAARPAVVRHEARRECSSELSSVSCHQVGAGY